MIKRTIYLDQIRPFIKKPLIKVLTGIRRCGKSTLMLQIIEELQNEGISPDQIIYINKELFEFDAIREYKELHYYVDSRSKNRKVNYYLFVDEIQEINGWERAINSFLAQKNYDIYITGSNASLWSSELATLLSGRYVEFKIYTLIFPEFEKLASENKKPAPEGDTFNTFLKFGGFPGIHLLDWDDNSIRQYLQSVYSTILLKDVVVRYNIRDAALLEKIVSYLADNCGNITSSKSISDCLKSQRWKVSVDTVQNYIQYCVSALLVEKVHRYDLKGKRILEILEKYYLSDIGLRYAIIGYSPEAISGQLENIVLLDLLAHGYQIFVGKQYEKEIDFIAQKGNEKLYIQVCKTLTDSKVVDREYGSLEAVNDHFPKYVLSLDKGFETSRNGIRWMNIKDFLKSPDKLRI
jgi:predicted AAA+ superfamily ATPase